MKCRALELKAIHQPHQRLWGPVVTCFPSFTLLMTASLCQTLCFVARSLRSKNNFLPKLANITHKILISYKKYISGVKTGCYTAKCTVFY